MNTENKHNNMIEGLVEEDNIFDDTFPLPDSFVERMAHKIADSELFQKEPLDIPTMTTDFVKEHGLPCPEGYIFKDQDGNVINATKIVLEKKKEYPKTYCECCKVMGINPHNELCVESPEDYADDYENKLFDKVNTLYKLLICRDAYWKIAGEEMGLGKSWKPINAKGYCTYAIIRHTGHIRKSRPCADSELLEFPTEEMRDAFKENFDNDLETCKEFL